MTASEVVQQQIQQHGGAYGTAAAGSSWLAAFLAQAAPIVQFVSLVLGCVVAVLTIIWYVKRIWGKAKD